MIVGMLELLETDILIIVVNIPTTIIVTALITIES